MPPAGGQGASQAFEDVHTLALVLEQVQQGRKDIGSALNFWQEMRKERIKGVLNMTIKWKEMREPGGDAVRTTGTVGMVEERLEQMRSVYGGLAPQEERIAVWAGQA